MPVAATVSAFPVERGGEQGWLRVIRPRRFAQLESHLHPGARRPQQQRGIRPLLLDRFLGAFAFGEATPLTIKPMNPAVVPTMLAVVKPRGAGPNHRSSVSAISTVAVTATATVLEEEVTRVAPPPMGAEPAVASA